MSFSPLQPVLDLYRALIHVCEQATGQANLAGFAGLLIAVGVPACAATSAWYHRLRKDDAFDIARLEKKLEAAEKEIREEHAKHHEAKHLHEAARARHPDIALARHNKEMREGNDLPAHNAITEFLRTEGKDISSILVHQAEWALSRVNGEGRANGLIAGEACATAAIIFNPSNRNARTLRKEAQRLIEAEGHLPPDLNEVIGHLDDFAIPIDPGLRRQANEAEAEAYRRYHQNQWNLALLTVEYAVRARTRAMGSNAQATLDLKYLQALLLDLVGRSAEGLPIIEEVVAGRQKELSLIHSDTFSGQQLKALILARLGRNDEALNLIEQVLENEKQHPDFEPNHLNTLATQHYQVAFLAQLGRNREALPIIEQVVEREKQHPELGGNHPGTLRSEHEYAQVLANLGRNDEALQIIKQVLIKQKQHPDLGPVHSSTLSSQHQLSLILTSLGRYDEALQIIDQVVKNEKNHPDFGPDHPITPFQPASTVVGSYKPRPVRRGSRDH